MLTIPATTVPANSAVDLTFDNQGGSPGRPVAMAPAGGALDATWANVTWIGWTEPKAGYGVSTSYAQFRLRIANPTTSQVSLAQQGFSVQPL